MTNQDTAGLGLLTGEFIFSETDTGPRCFDEALVPSYNVNLSVTVSLDDFNSQQALRCGKD